MYLKQRIESIIGKTYITLINKIFKKPLGFTLAEVLITIAIIGIVATIVIPSLLKNTSDSEFHTKLHKVYASINQAILRLNSDNGGTLWNDSGALDQGFWSRDNSNSMRNAFGTHLNFIKADITSKIFTQPVVGYKGTGVAGFTSSDNPAAVLSDGTFLTFISAQNCNQISSNINGAGTLSNICGYLHVDVNGEKRPNMMARDVYVFWIVKNNGNYRLLPFGTPPDGGSCSPGGNAVASFGCTYYAMLDIPY